MIFLIDFDNTISKQCSCTTMIDRFKISCNEEIEDQWHRGLLSTPDATVETLKILQMTEQELIQIMKTVEIDPYFIDFLAFCKQHGHEYVIVSDGFSILISTILNHHLNEQIKTFANQLVYCDSKWVASFPHYSKETPNLGVCKSKIVKQYQADSPVIYIGDGYTDYQAAEVADFVFAKDKLATYCQDRNIPYYPYTSFRDIIATCQKIF